MKRFRLHSLLVMILTAAVIFAVPAVPAQAKPASVDAAGKAKKAPELEAKKTYVVTQSKNYCYVKFTAPKEGTYRITVSDIKTTNGSSPDYQLGLFYVRVYKKSATTESRPYSLQVKTQGGKAYSLYMATSASYKDYVKKTLKGKDPKTTTSLSSRYAQLKLKKGQSILMNYYHTGKKGKCSYQIRIEKKK